MCSSEEDQVSSDLNHCFEIGDLLISKLSSTIDKRIRNLDKRRIKLHALESEQQQGKVLNEDQRISLFKLPLIEGNIEMAKEAVGLIKETSMEFSAAKSNCLAKKQAPKKERAPKPVMTDKLFLFISLLHSFASIDSEEKTSSDYPDLKLSDVDLKHLRSFIRLTRLSSSPFLQEINPEFPLISKHFSLLLDSAKESYKDNLSYYKLHKILLHLSSLQNLLYRMILDDLNTKPTVQTKEDSTQTIEVPVSLPELKPASTNTEQLEPDYPIEQPIPSQTILNQNAQDLNEQEFLISSTNSTTEVPLIPTTIFLSKKSDIEPEPIVTHAPPPEETSISPTPAPYSEQLPPAKSENILSFPGMNIPTLPAQSEEAFDFLHDSEISLGGRKSRSKQFPSMPSSQPQIPSALFDVSSFDASNANTFLGSRLPENSYKARAAPANNSSMFPARQSPTNHTRQPVNYPDVMPYQSTHFKSKEHSSQANIQQYLRSNQKEMAPLPQAPKTISNSSLAQPFSDMLVENSAGGNRQETPWDIK